MITWEYFVNDKVLLNTGEIGTITSMFVGGDGLPKYKVEILPDRLITVVDSQITGEIK